jgi:repressor LexA
MKQLTEKQKAVLNFVKKYKDENEFMPSIKEIADYFKTNKPNIVQHLRLIEKKGYIKRCSKARSIVILIDS